MSVIHNSGAGGASMTNHKQVLVKVNAFSDDGIAPLVEALSEIAGVITLDSCENGAWGAYIYFSYGSTWQELAALLQELSSRLSEQRLPIGYTFSMEWLGSKPLAQVKLEPEHVVLLAEGIRRVVASLDARMTGLVGGK